ncbi:MAG TPA: HD domain-containing phosphohydrolase [Verrucomicrobiae bacterium]|jgi:response regulator RpfG family c-di-GMP phosphodiesterase|nr:HD domain-containing phosphohydrolase [Verrucomicrobiae bacterium]
MLTLPEILFVDDDPDILAGFQRILRKEFKVDVAVGGIRALAHCATRPAYAVVVADMQMPMMNGIEFLVQLEEKFPDTVRIMLTGNADQKTARDAVNQGHIFRFLTKPCPPEELGPALRAGLKQYGLVTAERELLEKTLNGAAKVMSDILAMHDPFSFGRGQRLREYMRTFAESLKLKQTWDLELAALLSQIGCVTIPLPVLEKARNRAPLSGPEKDMLARAPELGSNLLANIPRLESVAQILLYQNKNFDGSGFPANGLKGEDIPVGARILRVLHDLLQYESRDESKEKALEAMTRAEGVYDPKALAAVAASFDICLTTDDAARAVRAVPLAELRVGHVLQSTAHTKDGLPIAPPGAEITGILLEKLRNFAELGQLAEPILILGA